jgi:hypothetical protein
MNARPIANIRPNFIQINLADLEIKRWEFRRPAGSRSVECGHRCAFIQPSQCLPSKYFGFNRSNIRDRYFIDLVSVLVHDDDEPPGPKIFVLGGRAKAYAVAAGQTATQK